jgi:uncharacterized membrane protein YhhN
MPALVAALIAALTYVAMVAAGYRGPLRVIKVIPALALATQMPTPALVAAMVFSAAGDAFLLDKARFMLPGLGAFLVAHLCFTGAFLSISGRAPGQPMLVLVALASAAILLVLWPHLRGVLRFAVPVYAFALAAMVASASTLGPLGVAGGLVFIASDTALGLSTFARPFPRSDLLVMGTYYTAMGLLAASVLT